MEQQAVYNAINFNFLSSYDVAGQQNLQRPRRPPSRRSSVLRMATRASVDDLHPTTPAIGDYGVGGARQNSYHGCFGATTDTYATSSGIFTYSRSFNIANVTDGTSNTIAFSEARGGR